MDKMSAQEYFKIKAIMTDNCGINCDDCPLDMLNNDMSLDCSDLELKFYGRAIEIVENWAKDHRLDCWDREIEK